MPLADLIGTLDRHQGAAVVFLTAVLVAVTIYYAVQNHGMVVEMRRARGLAVLPKLAIDFHRLAPTAVTLAIKNVGPGAALEIDLEVSWEALAKDGEPLGHRWRRAILAPGEQADFFPPGIDLNNNLNILPLTYRRVGISGRMLDATGAKHDVLESFDEIAEWRSVLGGARQRFVSADPERRLAEALAKQLDGPLRRIRGSIDGVGSAIDGLTSGPGSGEEDEGSGHPPTDVAGAPSD